MGRARGSAAIPAELSGPERRGRLSLVRGHAEPSGWVPTTLERLTQALDLRETGPRQFQAVVAEAEWPSFPGALLLASAVVAAERSFPGYQVGHMSCSFGQPPRADHPVGVALSEVHSGESCITGRMTFCQRGAVHGQVAVVLRSGATVAAGDPAPRCGRVALPPVPAAGDGGPRPPAPIVPWNLVSVLGPALAPAGRPRAVPGAGPAECCPAGCSRTWSRAPGAPSDGTLQRALLAYLSELLPIASAAAVPYPSPAGDAGGLSATVLSHAITYGARFDLREWLLAAVEGPAAGEGYLHALSTFRTRRGEVAATVSQAAAVWDQGRPPGLAGRSRPARHLMLSG
jgi:acyl-CoA thioesterase